MTRSDPFDIEKSLGSLTLKPVPPGLKKRILAAALEARADAPFTPRMRSIAVLCSILIAACLGIDVLLARHDAVRLAVLLDGRFSAVAVATAGIAHLPESGESAEIMALQNRITALWGIPKDRKNRITEARMRLKGWLENETFEILR